jgi:hypothetical protein
MNFTILRAASCTSGVTLALIEMYGRFNNAQRFRVNRVPPRSVSLYRIAVPVFSGPVDDFLASRGEGLMGVTIEVPDIAQVRDYLKVHAAGVLDPRWESADYVLIPSAAAHGLWIRMNEVWAGH